jgi:O-acetyl-ADP-ribose deacetylase (regulator of RNase III)
MPEEKRIGQSTLRLAKADITDLDIEAFVFYAQPDLKLGSGFGNAITVRGGPEIQKELDEFEPLGTGEAVVTGAGKLKAKYIIHAVGPRFREEDTEGKLRTTVRRALELVEEKQIERVAFPPMGTGFYGIPLEVCARVMWDTIKEHIEEHDAIKEVVICVTDTREYEPFKQVLAGLN